MRAARYRTLSSARRMFARSASLAKSITAASGVPSHEVAPSSRLNGGKFFNASNLARFDHGVGAAFLILSDAGFVAPDVIAHEILRSNIARCDVRPYGVTALLAVPVPHCERERSCRAPIRNVHKRPRRTSLWPPRLLP